MCDRAVVATSPSLKNKSKLADMSQSLEGAASGSKRTNRCKLNHQHGTPYGHFAHLARAWERNSRIQGRAPAPFVARGCSAKGASPLAPRWACAAVRPAWAHRTGVAAGPAVLLGGPAATSASASHPCTRRRPERSPEVAMPNSSPQRHNGSWGVAPGHLPAGRGLRTAEARPKATPRIHMRMSMKTGFYLFPKCLTIEQPHTPTDSTNTRLIITAQMAPGLAMRTPQSLKGSIKHQYSLFV